MAFNQGGQQFGQYGAGQYGAGQYGVGQFGPQYELGNVVAAVVQATLPVILGSLRGVQPQGAIGAPFGQPAFHAQGQWGGQPDLSNLLGPVLQATVPVILNSLRGQQQGWPGVQGFGSIGAPGFYAPGFYSPQGQNGGVQMGQFGGQADLGNVLGPILQATLPAILGSLQQGGQGMAGWRH